jgi:hypothetical protein
MTQTAQNELTLALCKIHILLPSSQQCMYPAKLNCRITSFKCTLLPTRYRLSLTESCILAAQAVNFTAQLHTRCEAKEKETKPGRRIYTAELANRECPNREIIPLANTQGTHSPVSGRDMIGNMI